MSTPRRSARLAAKQDPDARQPTPAPSKKSKKAASPMCLMDKVEAVSLFFTLAIYFHFYNPVGQLTAQRNEDYAPLLITELDKKLPTVNWLIWPYVIAFFCPIVSFWYQYFTNTLSLGQIRRAYLVQILMCTAGSVLFYYIPVSIDQINIKEKPASGFNALLNYHVIHTGMSLFCSFPSMHVAHAWYQWFYMRHMNHDGKYFMCIIAWLQFPATVLLRAHILADLPAGFLLSWIFAECIYVPMERAKFLEPKKNRPFSLPLAGAVSLLPVFTFTLYQYLLAITGWGGLSELTGDLARLLGGEY